MGPIESSRWASQNYTEEDEKKIDTVVRPTDQADLAWQSKQFKYGDIVAGMVVRVSQHEILIDIGTKSEGVVDHTELEKMSSDALKKIQVGERILAFVVKSENREGLVVLSLVRAQLERDWLDADQLLKSEQIFEVQVAGFNKGGLIVRVGKVRGFVPATQLESVARRRAESPDESIQVTESDLSVLVGKKIKLKVIELDRERNRLILSERAAMRELRKTAKEQVLGDLQEGDTRTGTVTSVADFGVFVDLGGVDGMIHLSELSWTKIGHPNELVKVGDKIQVQVMSVDRDRERIALSVKRLQSTTRITAENKLKQAWSIAEVMVDPAKLLVLCSIKQVFCNRVERFQYHFGKEFPFADILGDLELKGFCVRKGEEYILTQLGERVVARLDEI